MKLSSRAKKMATKLNKDGVAKGDIKKIAKEIRKDHELAMELWSTGDYHPRLLAVLIMDKKELTQEVIDKLAKDVKTHSETERNYIADWLLASQLMKDKKTVALMETWEDASSPLLRRLFWYHQARLRWTGQTPPDNTDALMKSLKNKFAKEKPEVQWAMNFCAGQIGVFDKKRRKECIALGEKTGLYKDEVVPKHCTPNYLPEFIRIEAAKREG